MIAVSILNHWRLMLPLAFHIPSGESYQCDSRSNNDASTLPVMLPLPLLVVQLLKRCLNFYTLQAPNDQMEAASSPIPNKTSVGDSDGGPSTIDSSGTAEKDTQSEEKKQSPHMRYNAALPDMLYSPHAACISTRWRSDLLSSIEIKSASQGIAMNGTAVLSRTSSRQFIAASLTMFLFLLEPISNLPDNMIYPASDSDYQPLAKAEEDILHHRCYRSTYRTNFVEIHIHIHTHTHTHKYTHTHIYIYIG